MTIKGNTPGRGFTLVEMLVSLFIFSLLSTATLVLLNSTLASRERVQAKSTELQKHAILRTLLKADLAETIVHRKTDQYGRFEPVGFSGGDTGDPHLIKLSRTGWQNPDGLERRSNLQAVDYILRGGNLIRRVSARYNSLETTEVYEQTLLSGVRSATFFFWDGREWVDRWITGQRPIGVDSLPETAALDLELKDGTELRQIFWVGADQ